MNTDAATRNRLKDTISGYITDTLTEEQVENAMNEIVATPRDACMVILAIARISAEFLKEAHLVPPRPEDGAYAFMVAGHSDEPGADIPVRTFGQILIALLNDDNETAHTIAHVAAARLSITTPIVGDALAFLYRSCHSASAAPTQKD